MVSLAWAEHLRWLFYAFLLFQSWPFTFGPWNLSNEKMTFLLSHSIKSLEEMLTLHSSFSLPNSCVVWIQIDLYVNLGPTT